MKENESIEFKESFSNSFLKTVSAFSNAREGKIYFGIDDNGVAVGYDINDQEQLRIENAINDSIHPTPNYNIGIQRFGEKDVLVLTVFKGGNAPYFYKGKAYKRTNTATIPADGFQIQQWAINSKGISFDELLSDETALTFKILEEQLQQKLLVHQVNDDILKTMSLLVGNQYTNAGMLIADNNSFRFGIDAVRFGETKSIFLERITLVNVSIISQYYKMIEFFETHYSNFEEVVNGERVNRIQIPMNAFREALANAIVHRNYGLKANIQIEFWRDKIVIHSPGGLPAGISEHEFLRGGITFLRNEIIASTFRRLNLIESFATGIWRIKDAYRMFVTKPVFFVSENLISVTLPVIKYDGRVQKNSIFSLFEEQVINALQTQGELKRSEIEQYLNLGTTQTISVINGLIDKNIVERIGKGRAAKYKLI